MWYLFFYIDELALSQAAVFIEDAFKVYQFWIFSVNNRFLTNKSRWLTVLVRQRVEPQLTCLPYTPVNMNPCPSRPQINPSRLILITAMSRVCGCGNLYWLVHYVWILERGKPEYPERNHQSTGRSTTRTLLCQMPDQLGLGFWIVRGATYYIKEGNLEIVFSSLILPLLTCFLVSIWSSIWYCSHSNTSYVNHSALNVWYDTHNEWYEC